MSTHFERACLHCKTKKRKCDKIVPTCSLCQRLNKSCAYESDGEMSRLLPVPDIFSLTPSNLRYTLEIRVASTIGHWAEQTTAAETYFRTVHEWLPIVSERLYYNKLRDYRVQDMPSDFSILTLCMHLICSLPVNGAVSAQTQHLYILIKGFISTLEAMGTSTTALLQSRLLITIFEIGHAMYPAAYISSGANVGAAVSSWHTRTQDPRNLQEPCPTETQLTWLGITTASRYTSLETNRQTSFREPPDGPDLNLDRMGPWLKLVRSGQILDEVLTHIALSPLDGGEALRILRSLTEFLTTFPRTGRLEPRTYSSLAICRSGMLEILKLGADILETPNTRYCVQTARNILQDLVHEILDDISGSTLLDTDTLSVFIPHCIFKTAHVLLSKNTASTVTDIESSVRLLKDHLAHMATRWTAAEHYRKEIERLQSGHIST